MLLYIVKLYYNYITMILQCTVQKSYNSDFNLCFSKTQKYLQNNYGIPTHKHKNCLHYMKLLRTSEVASQRDRLMYGFVSINALLSFRGWWNICDLWHSFGLSTRHVMQHTKSLRLNYSRVRSRFERTAHSWFSITNCNTSALKSLC